MKKILSLVLACVLLLGLAACGGAAGSAGAGGSSEPMLKIGFGKVDITPTEPVTVASDESGDENLNTGIKDNLFTTCTYFVDSNGTELYLIAFDICNMYPPLPEYRLELAEKLGVDESHLMFSASHTHSSVALRATQVASVARYNETLKANLEKVALQAKEDAKPATGLFHTSIETANLNFVRRYVMNDGTYYGDNYGDASSGIKEHESEGDRELQLVKFTREGGKDIILTNFQTHPHRTAYDTKNNKDLSADIVGVYRTELEERLDCLAMYYTGSAGNVNPTSKIENENIYTNYKEHGKAMANYAVKAAENWSELQLGTLKLTKTVYVGQSYLSENYKMEEAKIVKERFNSGMSKTECLEGYEDLFQHPRHAIAIVSRESWPETRDVPLYSFSIGDFAACYAPFEMFAELGVMLKDGSPFKATFVCCLSNYGLSYLPTQLAFDHGGYGPYKCNFEPGTGEIVVNEFLTDLKDLQAME